MGYCDAQDHTTTRLVLSWGPLYPCCIHAKCFVSLHYYGLDCCILFTPIQAPSMCMILANYRLLSEGCRLCWAAMVVQDGQGHVATSVLHPCQVFWNLVMIWIGLQYHQCTNSISKCCNRVFCIRIWTIARRVYCMLTNNGGPWWSVTCSHIHVASE